MDHRDHKEIQEHLHNTINSVLFKYIFQNAFSPVIKDWRRKITQDISLCKDERQGLIVAYNEFYKAFLSIYENAELDPPTWLFKEFDRE